MKHHSPTPLSENEKQSFAFPKPKHIVKVKRGLRRVGERKKRRITKYGTETEFFREIWETMPDKYCNDCLVHLREFSPYYFHHVKPK